MAGRSAPAIQYSRWRTAGAAARQSAERPARAFLFPSGRPHSPRLGGGLPATDDPTTTADGRSGATGLAGQPVWRSAARPVCPLLWAVGNAWPGSGSCGCRAAVNGRQDFRELNYVGLSTKESTTSDGSRGESDGFLVTGRVAELLSESIPDWIANFCTGTRNRFVHQLERLARIAGSQYTRVVHRPLPINEGNFQHYDR